MNKTILGLGLLFAAFTVCNAQASDVFSGHLSMTTTTKGEVCEILWGASSDRLSCKAGYSDDDKAPMIEIDLSKLKLKAPPTCVFEGYTHLRKDKTKPLKKIEVLLTNFNSKTLQVILPSFGKEKPRDMLFRFICTQGQP